MALCFIAGCSSGGSPEPEPITQPTEDTVKVSIPVDTDNKALPIPDLAQWHHLYHFSGVLSSDTYFKPANLKTSGFFGHYIFYEDGDIKDNYKDNYIIVHVDMEGTKYWTRNHPTEVFVRAHFVDTFLDLFPGIHVGCTTEKVIDFLGDPTWQSAHTLLYFDDFGTKGLFAIDNDVVTGIDYGRYILQDSMNDTLPIPDLTTWKNVEFTSGVAQNKGYYKPAGGQHEGFYGNYLLLLNEPERASLESNLLTVHVDLEDGWKWTHLHPSEVFIRAEFREDYLELFPGIKVGCTAQDILDFFGNPKERSSSLLFYEDMFGTRAYIKLNDGIVSMIDYGRFEPEHDF